MAAGNRRWYATVTHRPLIGIAIGSLYRFKRKLCHPIVNERISLFNVYRIQRKIKIPVLTLLLLFSSHSVLLELLLFPSLSLSLVRVYTCSLILLSLNMHINRIQQQETNTKA